jgi:hypothetical protein
MKKLVKILGMVILLFSCSVGAFVDNNEVSAAMESEVSAGYGEGEIVKLIKAKSESSYHYGIPNVRRYYEVKVKNLGYQKDIFIHGELDGEWVDTCALEYKRSLPDDYEIWSVYINKTLKTDTYNGEFVVKYVVNGVTYWDNNNEQNYYMDNHDGPMLGNDVNVLLNSAIIYNYSDVFTGTIDVQNLSYTKDVQVVYTTDGWVTTQAMPAIYEKWYGVAYSSSLPSPNIHGVERWQFTINIADAQLIEYAISYTVDGKTYWDNNFGQNYTLTRNQSFYR